MTRTASTSWLVALLALGLVSACGESMDTDAGPDGDVADTGTPPRSDAGQDAGRRADAGPQGCQSNCEYVQLAVGVLHVCGRRANGEVLCWGRNQERQLGDGRFRHMDCANAGSPPEDCSAVPVNVRYISGTSRLLMDDATYIASEGFSSSCAVREGGSLWCWSLETVPETAGGVQEQREAAELETKFSEVVAASATGGHLCVIQGASREVVCVGGNGRGQLGNGMFDEQVVDPVAVLVPDSFAMVVADAGMPMDGGMAPDAGDLDGGVPMDAGTDAGPRDGGVVTMPLVGALEVVIAGSNTCARTADDVFCWGSNQSDQLGDGTATTHRTCVEGVMDRFDCSPLPVAVGGPDETRLGTVQDIDVSFSYACAVKDGAVFCWGDNRAGQCAQPGAFETVGLPGRVGAIDDAVQVATGGGHACALHATGAISCWGVNLNGQLGDGVGDHGTVCSGSGMSSDCSRTPVSVATIDDATFIAANHETTCAIRGDGSVWCWGFNTARQLGDGTRETRSTPVMVMDTP